MRILHLIPNLVGGGAEQQLSYLAAAQDAAGQDVHVGYVHAGSRPPVLEAGGVERHHLAARANADPRLLVSIDRLVRYLNPDVVQTWLLQMDVAGGLACRLRRRAWVLSERASKEYWRGSGGPKGAVRAFLARGADAVVSNSKSGDSYWAPLLDPAVPRRVIANSVPIERIDRTPPRAHLRSAVGSDRKIVLFAGRFRPEKNIEGLVAGLADLGRRMPVTAFLCGDGPSEPLARRMVKALDERCDVRFVGYSEDVWSWMKGADAFVSVSHSEGHPNTVLEAAACGCPLVLSDIPSHRDMLSDSEAIFVDPASPAAIGSALERVLLDVDGACRRGSAARRRVESLASSTESARSYGEVYAEVLARRGRPGGRS